MGKEKNREEIKADPGTKVKWGVYMQQMGNKHRALGTMRKQGQQETASKQSFLYGKYICIDCINFA